MDPKTEQLVRRLYANPQDPAALSAVRQHLTEHRRFKTLAKLMQWWAARAPSPEAAADALVEASQAVEDAGDDPAQREALLRKALARCPTHAAASERLEMLLRERDDHSGLSRLAGSTLLRELADEVARDDAARRQRPSYRPALESRQSETRQSQAEREERLRSQRPSSRPSPKPPPAEASPRVSSPSVRPLPKLPARDAPASVRPPSARPLPKLPQTEAPASVRPPSARPLPKLPQRNAPISVAPPSARPSPKPPSVEAPSRVSSPPVRPSSKPPHERERSSISPLARPSSKPPRADVHSSAPQPEGVAVPRSPQIEARPRVGMPEIEDGFEPQLFGEEQEDDEQLFRQPFAAQAIIGVSASTPQAEGGESSGAPVVEVIRMRDGRVLEADTVQGLRGAILGHRRPGSALSVRKVGSRATVRFGTPVAATLRRLAQATDAPAEPIAPETTQLRLGPGDVLELQSGIFSYQIRVFRPPAPPPPPQRELSATAKLYGMCGLVALGAHLMALLAVMLLHAAGVAFKVEDRPQEEIFAEIRSKPPEERKPKKKLPPRIRRKQPKHKEPPPPERKAAIPKSLRKTLRSIARARPEERAQRVLTALTSPVQGDGQTLDEVVTNLDAVKGGTAAGAFRVGGTLAGLKDVSGVKIASGGGGDVNTLGGEAATKKVAKLKARKGTVRGRVRAVSVGSRVTGSLSRAQVLAVIDKHMGKIQRCYEQALTRNATAAGRVSFNWTINPQGRVSNVRQASSTLGDQALATCISTAIKRMRFPRPKGGPVTVTFPFIFRRAM